MKKKVAVLATLIAAAGLALVAFPAVAQEPAPQATATEPCAVHADPAMASADMGRWMGVMAGHMGDESHARIEGMMSMSHGDHAGQGMDGGPMGTGPMMGTGS
jgi:hypothetical protein